MKIITSEDLHKLELGSAVLGSGGGGSTYYQRLIAEHAIEQFGPVKMLEIHELNGSDLVVPLANMGAPLVALEKLPSGNEFSALSRAIQNKVRRSLTAVMPAEIGGGNAFTPIIAAAYLGVPVVNCDTIGRAFPELHMSSCFLNKIRPVPAFLADSFGTVHLIEEGDSFEVEKEARKICIANGSRLCAALYLMEGFELKTAAVPGTISSAISIGEAILQARESNLRPGEAAAHVHQGSILFTGKIGDVDSRIEGGFLKGSVLLEGAGTVRVLFQNEFLLALREETLLGATPDILTLLEMDSGTPISTAYLQYGLEVDLIRLKAPEIWRTDAGLKIVGPGYFGYLGDNNKGGK